MAKDRYTCCPEKKPAPIGDLGSITGFDLLLQRCESCGAYMVNVHWAGSNTDNVLDGIYPGILKNYKTIRDEVSASLRELGGVGAP